MKITVWTRNRVRTTLDEAQVVSQVRHLTPSETWVSVTLRDGRSIQLRDPVPGIECLDHDTRDKKKKTTNFLQKLAD